MTHRMVHAYAQGMGEDDDLAAPSTPMDSPPTTTAGPAPEPSPAAEAAATPPPAAGTAPAPPPPMGAPTAPYYGQPMFHMQRWPEESQAVMSLVFSILGIVACGVLGPVGWYFATKELEAIDGGRRDPSKRDMATAAKWIGIAATVLVVLSIVFVVVWLGGFILLARNG